jgi:long-chain acyl-CoA synthetase
MSLGQLLHDAAARHPRHVALVCRDRSLTYQELDQECRALARRLLAEGLRTGDRVGVHWANSVETVKLLYACFYAGLIALPINVRLKAPELSYIMSHSGAAAWFSQPELAALANLARADAPGAPEIRTDLPAGLESGLLPEIEPSQIAAVLYTSGTTARPKGVTHTHATLTATIGLMNALGLDGTHTTIFMVSVMHASGLMCLLIPTLSQGSTAVLLPAFDAAEALDTIQRHRCSFIAALPAMGQFLVEEQSQRPRDVSSTRLAYSGGDAVPVKLQERFRELFGIPLFELYGMTEGVPSAANLGSAHVSGSIGRPVPGVEMQVLDLLGRPVPDGQTGEIAFRSKGCFTGYWNDPRNTADTLVEGWVLSGDLGHRDADGYFWFDGRKKEIIVRCGSNISPQEVEEVLYQHPAVLEAGVIGVPHAVHGEQVVACISLKEGCSADEAEVQSFARARLADYKVPERIVFLGVLPKGITGKVQRRALKELTDVQARAAVT